MRDFVARKVPWRTIYALLERSEHFQAQRANGSGGKIAKKNVQKTFKR